MRVLQLVALMDQLAVDWLVLDQQAFADGMVKECPTYKKDCSCLLWSAEGGPVSMEFLTSSTCSVHSWGHADIT